jgi:hypothetical protein
VSAAPEPDAASAEEILRHGERLLLGQFDASKALDSKAVSILQASLSLGGASLGAATLAFSRDGVWLPWWASSGLAAGGFMFLLSAFLAAVALQTVQLEAPAVRPGTLLNISAQSLPVVQLRLALAFELDRRIDGNQRRTRDQARRVERSMRAALAAPLFGSTAAGLAALPEPGLGGLCHPGRHSGALRPGAALSPWSRLRPAAAPGQRI